VVRAEERGKSEDGWDKEGEKGGRKMEIGAGKRKYALRKLKLICSINNKHSSIQA